MKNGAQLLTDQSKISLRSGRRDDVGMDHFETPVPMTPVLMSNERRGIQKRNTYDIEDINPLENFVDQNIDEKKDQIGVKLSTNSELDFSVSDVDMDADLDLQNGNP